MKKSLLAGATLVAGLAIGIGGMLFAKSVGDDRVKHEELRIAERELKCDVMRHDVEGFGEYIFTIGQPDGATDEQWKALGETRQIPIINDMIAEAKPQRLFMPTPEAGAIVRQLVPYNRDFWAIDDERELRAAIWKIGRIICMQQS